MKLGKNLLIAGCLFFQTALAVIIILLQRAHIITGNNWIAVPLLLVIVTVFCFLIIRETDRRKQAEAYLQNYTNLLQHTPVFIRNMKDEIVSWNKGMEKLYGWSEREVIGRVSHQILSTVFPRPPDEIKNFLLFNKQWQGEFTHTRRNNKPVHVCSQWSLIRDEAGNPALIMETVTDTSRLKQMEKMVATLSDELNKSNDAIYTVGLNRKIKTWNKGAEKLYGFTCEEALDCDSNELLQTSMPAPAIDKITGDMYATNNWRGELLRKSKAGEELHVFVSASPVVEQGTVTGFTTVSYNNRTQIKLREYAASLAGIINQSNDAIYTTDLDHKIKTSNKGAENLYGFTREEALGQTSNNLLQTTIGSSDISNAIKQLSEMNYWIGDLKRKTKQGHDIYVYTSASTIRKKDGTITGYISASHDITDKVKLRAQVVQLASLVDQSGDAIVSVNMSGQILSWNKGAFLLYGYNAAEAIGQSIFMIIPPGLLQEEHAIVEKIKNGIAVSAFETQRMRKDGSHIFVSLTLSVVRDHEGRIISVAGIARNITEQKKADKLLQQSFNSQQLLADRMNCILNTLPANIALLNDSGIIVDVNNTWKNFADDNRFQGTNYGIGQNYISVADNSLGDDQCDGKKIADGIRSVIEHKANEFIFEYSFSGSENQLQRWFRMTVTPFKNKEHTGAVVMHTDITELRQLYQEKFQSKLDEQKRLNRHVLLAREKERNQLGRDLHDNICQLLAALKMKLDFCLVNNLADLSTIEEAVSFLEDAINEARDMSHRMIIPRFTESSLIEALTNLTHTYTHAKRSVVLECSEADEKNIPVTIKETLYRIAQEKLNNIHKYAEASCVTLALAAKHDLITMTIEDNGIGFDTVKKKPGIGITNIINRAESLNGSAKIDSALGKGCRLLVEIPIVPV